VNRCVRLSSQDYSRRVHDRTDNHQNRHMIWWSRKLSSQTTISPTAKTTVCRGVRPTSLQVNPIPLRLVSTTFISVGMILRLAGSSARTLGRESFPVLRLLIRMHMLSTSQQFSQTRRDGSSEKNTMCQPEKGMRLEAWSTQTRSGTATPSRISEVARTHPQTQEKAQSPSPVGRGLPSQMRSLTMHSLYAVDSVHQKLCRQTWREAESRPTQPQG